MIRRTGVYALRVRPGSERQMSFPNEVMAAARADADRLGSEEFLRTFKTDVFAYLADIRRYGLQPWSKTELEWKLALETSGFHTTRVHPPCDADNDARLVHAALALPLVLAKIVVCHQHDIVAVDNNWIDATRAVLEGGMDIHEAFLDLPDPDMG